MANFEYISATGVIVPDTATLRDQVIAEYKAALGDDLVTDPSTPEGALITAETLARDTVVRNNAALANQINPNLAGGAFLDAIWALLGGERTPETRSIATVTATGANGTIIGTNVRFKSIAGDEWAVLNATTIMAGNTAQVDVRAVEYGPVSAPIGAINQIFVSAVGLETVTNAAAATLGVVTQSDFAVRQQRRRTLAADGVGLPVAITSALYEIEGVKSLTFRENITNVTQIIDGVSLVAHSIYVCVDGGSDNDIAVALLRKSLGANYNGDETVNIEEPASGQLYPVKFSRPDVINILIKVSCRVTNPLINPQTAVREAIMNYVNGLVAGEDGFVVGGSVSPFELAGAITVQYPNIYVQKVEVAPALTSVFTTNEIPIAIFEKAQTTSSSITVISV